MTTRRPVEWWQTSETARIHTVDAGEERSWCGRAVKRSHWAKRVTPRDLHNNPIPPPARKQCRECRYGLGLG